MMIRQQSTARGEVALFLLVTFAFTWAFWVPMALIALGWNAPGPVVWLMESPLNVAAFGPAVGAIVIMLRRGGLRGAVDFLIGGLTRRFRLRVLVPALALFPLITGAALFVAKGPEALAFPTEALPGIGAALFSFAIITLNSGPLQEEFGWRGFLMPALQSRMPGLAAALIVGVIWAFWHFPLNFEEGGRGPQYSQMLPVLIGSIVTLTLISVVIGWIYNVSNGSVLVAILMHGSLNFSTFVLFPVFQSETALAVYTGLILVAAVAVTVFGGPRLLGRPAPL